MACHPGYGFLSENTEFLSALEERSIAFVGPTADTMRMFSRKHTARQYAQEAGVPVLPGASFTRLPDRCCCQDYQARPADMQLALGTDTLTVQGSNRRLPFLQREAV